MKSQKQLESFTAYCESHPEERFFQALRNWSGYKFIWGEIEDSQLEDTFYK